MGVPTPQFSASSDGRVMLWRGHEPAAYVDAATALTSLGGTTVGKDLFTAADAAAALAAIGLSGILGAWTAYTPSVSAGTGAFGSASATGRYLQVGKTVFFNLTVTIVSNGTAATYVTTTLPVACKSVFVFFGREDAATGAVFQAKSVAASTSVNMFTFSNTYPGGNGYQLVISGSYEAN